MAWRASASYRGTTRRGRPDRRIRSHLARGATACGGAFRGSRPPPHRRLLAGDSADRGALRPAMYERLGLRVRYVAREALGLGVRPALLTERRAAA